MPDTLPKDLAEAREHVAKAIQAVAPFSNRVITDGSMERCEYFNMLRVLELLGRAHNILLEYDRQTAGAGCELIS